MRGRRKHGDRFTLSHPLPEGRTFFKGLSGRLEVKGVVIGQAQFHERARSVLVIAFLLEQLQSSLVVVDRLPVGVKRTRSVPRLQ